MTERGGCNTEIVAVRLALVCVDILGKLIECCHLQGLQYGRISRENMFQLLNTIPTTTILVFFDSIFL